MVRIGMLCGRCRRRRIVRVLDCAVDFFLLAVSVGTFLSLGPCGSFSFYFFTVIFLLFRLRSRQVSGVASWKKDVLCGYCHARSCCGCFC
jgi:hypothetical protein